MTIIYILAPLALMLGAFFALAYILATRRGQFDDLETPPQRMLLDDDSIGPDTRKGR